MKTDDLDFELPSELIAQEPVAGRSGSRLLHYQRQSRAVAHRIFSDLPQLLREGDLLVFNNAKVIPARFTLRKNTGGRVEGLFLRELSPGRWRVLLKSPGKIGPMHFAEDPSVSLEVIDRKGEGEFEVQVSSSQAAHEVLGRIGRMPLPPYIKREKDHDPRDERDRDSYQTIYAKAPGSVAAPTAGLHFTPEIMEALSQRGIEQAQVTLHVGIGTFRPVSVEALSAHAMHSERYEVDAKAAEKLNRAAADKRRIVAIGTTSCRVLESYPDQPWTASTGETAIFIYPPYQWKRVGALLTNFHLPRSTLVALVAAMVGLDTQRMLYTTAIENRYRFFSYGDAMLIE